MQTEEDVIVVDDEPVSTPIKREESLPVEPSQQPRSIAEAVRANRRVAPIVQPDASVDRTTRSTTTKPKIPPKLKLKLSEKSTIASGTSFLGPYDRELDSDEEDLAFEEQFILRMPPGEDCERLRKMLVGREITNDVWLKFKDSRRGVFHIGNNLYSSKLVDLPCIIESQKTLDNKQMFKVADICQMLVVENKINSEDGVGGQKGFNIDEFIWPHGVTAPLHQVRKRRFRKRVNKRTIETVEQEVERLLESDAMASQVVYDVLENVNPDLSDSEFIEREVVDAPTPGVHGSDAGDAPTPGPGNAADDGDDDEDEAEGDIDEELAAELDLALGDEDEDGEDEEGDDDDDDDSDDDEVEEDEDEGEGLSRRLLNEEIRDLEAAVAKKNHEIASSVNPLIKRRFEDALKKLQAELDMKQAQRDELREQQQMRKAGIVEREESEPNDEMEDGQEVEMDDDIFGPSDGNQMDMDIQ